MVFDFYKESKMVKLLSTKNYIEAFLMKKGILTILNMVIIKEEDKKMLANN